MILKLKPKWKLELVENCNLIRSRSVPNGHDCWGNFEWSREYYVRLLNGTEERVYSGQYVIHNDKDIKKVCYNWEL